MRQSIATNVAYAARSPAGCRIFPLRQHYRHAGVRFSPTVWDKATGFARFCGKITVQAAAFALFILYDQILAGFSGPKNVTFSGNLRTHQPFERQENHPNRAMAAQAG